MGKKSKPPKPPDLKPITDSQLEIAKQTNNIAMEHLGLSRQQFEFFQENAKEELALARQQADRLFEFQNKAFASDQEVKEFARQVGQTQIDAMKLQMDYARRDRERYEKEVVPMQQRYFREAQEYDTADRREREAGQAMVDIQRQADAARVNADARLRSMGIDPSQMRSASLLETQGVGMAAQQALAANAARQNVEDRGRAMRADALNVGAGLPAQALAAHQAASGSGAAAIGAGQATQGAQLAAIQGGAGVGGTAMGFRSSALGNLANLTGSPAQWAGMGTSALGQASNSYANAASTMNQDYQNRQQYVNAKNAQSRQMFEDVVSVAGIAAGFMAEGGHVGSNMYRHGAIKLDAAPMPAQRYANPPMAQPMPVAQAPMPPMAQPQPVAQQPLPMPQDPRRMPLARHTGGMQYNNAGMYAGAQVNQGHVGVRQMYMAEGGHVGPVPSQQSRDKVPVMLSPDEYVLPADVTRALGLERLDKLVKKYHRPGS